MTSWPPRDVRAFAALIFSVLGGMALTALLVWFGYALSYGGWSAATEKLRAGGVVNAMLIVACGVVVVMVALGWAINRRKIEGGFGGEKGARFSMEGGDEAPVAAAAQTVAAKAQEAADHIAEGATP